MELTFGDCLLIFHGYYFRYLANGDMIWDFGTYLIGFICVILCYSIEVGLITSLIRGAAKKKWRKNLKIYPYFSYPFWKKIFFWGLKGVVSRAFVVVVFMYNVATVLCLVFVVWGMVAPSTVIAACAGYGVAVWCLLGALVLTLILLHKPSFK